MADPLSSLPFTALPDHGLPADEVLGALSGMKANDQDWRGGRVFSLVYSAGDEVHALLEKALGMYAAENGLNVLAFPSIGSLQHDLVRITASLLGADGPDGRAGIEGYVTSGGTESLLQAVKTARDYARAERGIERPGIVAATSAHAAFTKAAEYFDMDLVRVPVGADYRADPGAMADAITEATVLLVGSAPTYPQGVVDPIEELGALAASRGLLFHVDACMGGYLLPFLTRLGRFDTPFDFRVDGVTSMSADLHKYGYAAKGVSIVLYADAALARYQVFKTNDWLGGFYASTTVAGTRPAGPIAAAWAAVMHLGLDGYLRLTEAAYDAAVVLREGIASIEGLEVRGDPPATVMAFGASAPDELDIFVVGEALSTNGWYLDRQRGPDSLHVTVHAGHAATVGQFVDDLSVAVRDVGGHRAADRATTYGASESSVPEAPPLPSRP